MEKWKVGIEEVTISVGISTASGSIRLVSDKYGVLASLIPRDLLPLRFFEMTSFKRVTGIPVSRRQAREFAKVVIGKMFEFSCGLPLVMACSKRDAEAYLSLIVEDLYSVEPIYGTLAGRMAFSFATPDIEGTDDDQILMVTIK